MREREKILLISMRSHFICTAFHPKNAEVSLTPHHSTAAVVEKLDLGLDRKLEITALLFGQPK